ncbi:MAG TPA: alginate lyase family protein [Desulfobacteria bacterium]|nr:alginate lyase family protein [Desulfobacteria bacterium]
MRRKNKGLKVNFEKELKAEYVNKGLDKVPDTFILYRIIGNDLYPRHKKGQARQNLQFILENEPEHKSCQKRWIVNRITDKEEEKAIIELLRQHNKEFMHIPFSAEEYRLIGWDTGFLPVRENLVSEKYKALGTERRDRLIAALYRHKNNYLMNNNGARNIALRDGKRRAKWVLPWDGNCFVTREAWKQIQIDVTAAPYLKYFVVPMTRVVDNRQLLTEQFVPRPVEEPQIIFRQDSVEEFNEKFCYGRRPKVEMLWRLGIPGKWNCWRDDPWDQVRRPVSAEAHQFGFAGWVARMYSGMEELEQDNKKSFKKRGIARLKAVITAIRNVDALVSGKSANCNALSIYRTDVLAKEKNSYLSGVHLPPVDQLIADAEEALKRGPFSVIDKKTLPPSGNIHDYWHPAPYWWPNPNTKDGLPYVRRDGERVPGTRMYEPASDKYDRTRLQRVFDDSITLALAWYFTGKKTYAAHGARILERFFVNPGTRMTPHLKYAQVRYGKNNNTGTGAGIIEMKDFYYYLDAVRLLKSADVIPEETWNSFRGWLSTYLNWLIQSPQGKNERNAINNHGTYYDLQVSAIADFLDDRALLFETLIRAQSRIVKQFKSDGSQSEELKRKATAHYCCFNYQGWINLAEIASRWGNDFWSYKASNGASLVKGAQWLLSHAGASWPYEQINEFDTERFYPIWFGIPHDSMGLPAFDKFPKTKYEMKPRFFPHDGVRPYWSLGLI